MDKTGKILLFILAYVLIGRVTLLLAIPPGFAAAIFPPAGMALAAVLMWGYPLLAGVFLGSLLLNLSVALAGDGSLSQLSYWVAAGIAGGSTLQCSIAVWLARNLLGYRKVPASEVQLLKLLLLCGPLACWVAALIGPGILVLAGLSPAAAFPYSFLTWWVGDSAGVLIAAPLMLILFAEPREIWRGRLATIALPLLAGCLAVVLLFVYSSRNEQQAQQRKFQTQAKLMQAVLQSRLDQFALALDSISRFYLASQEVTADEFVSFTEKLPANYPGIQSLLWAEEVTQSQRPEWERAQRQAGRAGFSIRERDGGGHWRPAVQREAYFPISFAVPLLGNENLFGLDFASLADLNRIILSYDEPENFMRPHGAIHLVQDQSQAGSFFMFHWAQTEKARGVVIAQVRLEALFKHALKQFPEQGYRLHLRDNTVSPPLDLFGQAAENLPRYAESLAMDMALRVGDRLWQLRIEPSRDYLQQQRSLQSWLILVVGLFFNVLLGGFLLVLSGREESIRDQVKTRTLALKRQQQLTETIAKTQAQFIQNTNSRQAFEQLLADVLALTGSEFGFICRQQQADEGKACFTPFAVSLPPLGYAANALPIERLQPFMEQALAGGEAVMVDRFSAGDSPAGQWALDSFLCMPIRSDDPAAVLIGLANRAGGYQEDLVIFLQPLLSTLGQLIEAGRVKQEAEELRQRLQKIAANVPGTVYQYQLWPDGRAAFPYASEGIYQIYGVRPEQVAADASPIFKVLHPDDIDRVAAGIRQSAITLNTWYDQYRAILPDSGRVIWLEGEAEPEAMADGSVLWHGYIRDITDRKWAEQELHASEEKLRNLYELSPLGIALTDLQGRYIQFNEAFRAICGYPADELRKIDYWVLTPEKYREQEDKQLESLLRTGNYGPYEKEYRRKDGSLVPINLNGRLVTGGDGQRLIWSIVEDITYRKQAEEGLQQAASVFQQANEGILIADANACIVDVNRAFTRITGYRREEVLGKNPRMFSSGRQGPEFYAEMWRCLNETDRWSGEVWNRNKQGEVFAELLTISTIRNSEGQVQRFVALFTDITLLKEKQRQLEYIAHFDALTRLPNRVLLGDRLQQAMIQAERRHSRVAVAYLDLDGFKAVNDTYGHATGDQLLVEVAEKMKQALRDGDTLARLGGDEFVAVLPDLHEVEDAGCILDRLLKAASNAFLVNELKVQVSSSIGVSFYPQAEAMDADQLLRQADQAMYQAKQLGKNRYQVFDVASDLSLRSRHESIDRIRQALENGEFVLYYQPKVNLYSGQVVGCEALIRWQHPERGLLSPIEFLPLIEDHVLHIPLGNWVLRTALDQFEKWYLKGIKLPISINIDGVYLQHPEFFNQLRLELELHSDVGPGDLELEILETSTLEDIVHISEQINACRDLGIVVALDDFGTGYSSLTYLKRLPIHTLKIDQSFVRGMLEDPDDLAILEGVMGLARAFGLEAIAEGVETEEHCQKLLQLGCELGQGYAIARPMPADAIEVWMQNRPDMQTRFD